MLAYIKRRKWDITLLTEIRAESRGILWFGEEESETAVINSEKTAVVLRGEEMRRWREERQRRRYSERSTTVKIGNMKIMAVYQPLWSNGREGVERYREEIEEELAGSSREEVLILSGDHNSQIGRGKEMEGIKGKYGLHPPHTRLDITYWSGVRSSGCPTLIPFSPTGRGVHGITWPIGDGMNWMASS